jgi:hypothetical protein
MSVREWSNSNAAYGRRLVSSGLEGARSGREAFLHGGALAPYIRSSFRNAIGPAAIGVCLGILKSIPKRRCAGRAVGFAVVGGVVGFGLGLVWQTRRLAGSIASEVFESIERVRDEHWLEKHPIDYA